MSYSAPPYTGTTLLFANNAGSTLAGPISNVSTSLALQSGAGALFPLPSIGQSFIVTLVDAATGLLREIVQVGSVSGDVFSSIIRAREGTTALNWLANDLVQQLWTAGQAATMYTFIQQTPANVFYVNGNTGSDSNRGLTPTTAFATLQGAVNSISQYQYSGTVTVNVAAATYTASPGINQSVMFIGTNLIGGWNFVFASGSIIDASSTGMQGIYANNYQGTINITGGVTIKHYAIGARVGTNVTMTFGNVTFQGMNSAAVAISARPGNVNFGGSALTFTGTIAYPFQVVGGGGSMFFGPTACSLNISGATINNALMTAYYSGFINYVQANVTWTGTTSRSNYYVLQGGGIDTSGTGTAGMPGVGFSVVSASGGWAT